MPAALVIALKDLKLLLRDRAGLFFTFCFPLVYGVFFGEIFDSVGRADRRGPIAVAVVDEDGTAAAKGFVARLQATPEIQAHLEQRQEAYDDVRLGQRAAYVIIPPGFGEAYARLFWGSPPQVELGVDPRRAAETGLLQALLTRLVVAEEKELTNHPDQLRDEMIRNVAQIRQEPRLTEASRAALESFFRSLGEIFRAEQAARQESAAGGSEHLPAFRGFEPLKVRVVDIRIDKKRPRNAFAVSFPQGIIWGVMACAAGFGVSLASERSKGTLTRLRVAPMRSGHIVAGKAIACMATIIGMATVMLIASAVLFGVRADNPPLLGLTVLCVAVAFAGMMMLLAALARSEQSATGLVWAILTVMAMVGGAIVPVFYMPAWMQPLSDISPVKWAIYAFEGPIWRDFTLADMWEPCGILIGVGVVCFALGAAKLARSNGQ